MPTPKSRNPMPRRGSLLLLLLALAATAVAAQCRPLILMTNDDGAGAPGLEAIYRQLKDVADIYVVAPAENQSGVSHQIDTYDPIYVKPYAIDGQTVGCSVATTPATCVIMGLEVFLPRTPDLVVSGINRGSNPGAVSLLSGTVAAARQAALRGVKAIALSVDVTDPPNYDAFAAAVKPLIVRMLTAALPAETFLNVNGPALAAYPKGLLVTKASRVELMWQYERVTNIRGRDLYWVKGVLDPRSYPADTDWGAMQAGYISVTPMTWSYDHGIDLDALARGLELPKK
ncbi:MAG TPA: 5'/3'-nucleotidase SurE [Acidobacteriota bacterium]|nr:5'/3'-nucleotidase SurE [Acidobacteriota bacterium]